MTLLNLERAKIQITEWVKNHFGAQKLASFAIITAMLPIAILPVSAPKPAIDETYKSHVAINTASADLFASDAKSIQIVPGESQVQKAEREKAEVAAKAVAEAQAKLAGSRNTVTRERRVYNDPSDFDSIYARAEATYGVDARILKAIHQVETGGSGSTGLTNHSGSGATGPMQFLPSTWRRHGVDGNGDGTADINNVEDAIFSAAAYLKACGYPNVQKALWGYNPSTSYYNKVTRLAGM